MHPTLFLKTECDRSGIRAKFRTWDLWTLWQICVLRCSKNARRCARNEKRYARSCARSEKRYVRREGRNSSCNSNSNKHHCLHHHQFHLVISTENL